MAFVGPSGSGKTTALKLITGSVRPTTGRVLLQDRDLTLITPPELRRVRSRIGFIHQGLCLLPHLRVWQNVIVGQLGRSSLLRSIRNLLYPPRTMLEEVHALLSRVGIGEKIFQRTHHLSGGQQQRVAIARALFQKPRILLADEPVASVDPARARDTVELLTHISREEGLTLCMSLHNLDLARSYFQRLVGLRGGQIVFDQPASTIRKSQWENLYQLTHPVVPSDAP